MQDYFEILANETRDGVKLADTLKARLEPRPLIRITQFSCVVQYALLNLAVRIMSKRIHEYSLGKHPYLDDPYFALPLLKQRLLVGVLYLGNHRVPGVFTTHRSAVLEMLTSQSAISLVYATLAWFSIARPSACPRVSIRG